MINKKDYWVVEFNENGKDVKNYEGLEVTEDLIDELKSLDEKIHDKKKGKGYYKFYFDNYVDGERVHHVRVDIGDGNEANEIYFNGLLESITESKINSGEIIVDENKKVDEEEFLKAITGLRIRLYKLDNKVDIDYIIEPIIRLRIENKGEVISDQVRALVDNFKYQNYLLNF
ncbi:hypothetical protein NH288_04840 [Anaerococcus sp. NML200537]|uniref:hypothetical protein n=1 Tax=Anaerococcus sp. NML200537 TaxID=2954485 RepID=UPI002237BC9D|nr:hypothetical protein [Anaerococcus sp. NML200537]MCW6701410.1 hypothetical protein [Anaerococcus sp. NML200537]